MINFNIDEAIAYNTERVGEHELVFARMVAAFQAERDLLVDGKFGPLTEEHYRSRFGLDDDPAPRSDALSIDVLARIENIYDLRDHLEQGLPPVIDRRNHSVPSYVHRQTQKRIYYTPRRRLWRNVKGWTLHQTACVLGDHREDRWDTVGAHRGVSGAGQRYILHDLDRTVIHGNGWNARTGGIEIDGLFAGVEGDQATVWQHGRQSHLTDIQIQAAMWTIVDGDIEVGENGGEMNALVAHRQSSGSRRNDPGGEIWRRIAMPMQALLDLQDGGQDDHHFRIGDGLPIPEAWDPSRVGVPY